MAEPPNALTDLLRGKTPEEIYETLETKQCLTPAAVRERDHVIAVIKDAEASHRQQVAALMVGPTREYVIAGALFGASYLNDKARKLLAANTVNNAVNRARSSRSWWKLW